MRKRLKTTWDNHGRAIEASAPDDRSLFLLIASRGKSACDKSALYFHGVKRACVRQSSRARHVFVGAWNVAELRTSAFMIAAVSGYLPAESISLCGVECGITGYDGHTE